LVPDIRWQTLVKAVTDKKMPEDLYLARVYKVMTGETQDDTIAFALDIINTPVERDCLVAYFLAGASVEYICKSLGLKDEVCRNFGYLYIDMDTFRYRLEVLRYADYYMCTIATKQQQELIKQGLHQGPEYITYHINPVMHEQLSNEKVANKMLALSFYTASVAKSLGIESSASKQALRWMGTATKILTISGQNVQDPDDFNISLIELQQPQTLETMQLTSDNLVH